MLLQDTIYIIPHPTDFCTPTAGAKSFQNVEFDLTIIKSKILKQLLEGRVLKYFNINIIYLYYIIKNTYLKVLG